MAETLEKVLDDPFAQFEAWFLSAQQHPEIHLPEAMSVSTLDKFGRPDARMILLKGFDRSGFLFYTNLQSPKGEFLLQKGGSQNRWVALLFYWAPLRKQVRIQGTAQLIGDEEADNYFKTRDRFSQIGAWASRQSAVLPDRLLLVNRFHEFEKKFAGCEVPRPPFWSGFRVAPHKMEFWLEQPNRLHDRFLYEKIGDKWEIKRLYP